MSAVARRLVVLLLLLAPLRAAAGQQGASTDAAAIAPDRFKVLLENEHVRVLEYTLRPGERDPWHTHPAKVSYVVEGGELRIHLADGKSFLSTEAKGAAEWREALPSHYAENVGKTPVRILLFEVKSRPSGPGHAR